MRFIKIEKIMKKTIAKQLERLGDIGFQYSFLHYSEADEDMDGGMMFELLFTHNEYKYFDTPLGKELTHQLSDNSNDVTNQSVEQVVLGKVHATFIYPSDYPFKPPCVSFINIPHYIKHPCIKGGVNEGEIDNNTVGMGGISFCDWCPAMDIKQQIIHVYLIFDEILHNSKYEEIVQLGHIIQETIPLVSA